MITDTSLPETFNHINRCRGFFVYTHQGRRYLDLYRDNGSLIMGHRIKGVGIGLKNFLEKGNWGRYPAKWQYRAQECIKTAFSDYAQISFFPTVHSARTAIESLTGSTDSGQFFDPAVDTSSPKSKAGIWRPFLETPATEYLIPWIPYSGNMLPVIVLGPEQLNCEGYTPCQYQFSIIPKVMAAVTEYISNDFNRFWALFEHPLWNRTGPYLQPAVSKDMYNELFSLFFENGILLSPEYSAPSVLPDALSDGLIAQFLRLSEEYYGKC